jgi:hypothetical protein
MDRPFWAALERELDEPRVAAMKSTQEVYRIREVSAGVRARAFQQGVQIRMARASVSRNTGELRFGNADRVVCDRPIDRHSIPSFA